MEISGKELAEELIKNISSEISSLTNKGIIPQIAIVTLGPEDAWSTYVGQKVKLARKLGLKITLINISDTNEKELLQTIDRLNKDKGITGIIVQRPMPSSISTQNIITAINPKKDIDGFRDDSDFEVPSFLAVKHILSYVADKQKSSLKPWLKEKKIIVIGKGETAGMPTINGLRSLGLDPLIVDSKTKDKNEVLKTADIIISAVGKEVVEKNDVKKGVVLIGIGIAKRDGALKGDYDESEIKNIVSFYTPTPGGVGPINLAYLFKNLIKASKNPS